MSLKSKETGPRGQGNAKSSVFKILLESKIIKKEFICLGTWRRHTVLEYIKIKSVTLFTVSSLSLYFIRHGTISLLLNFRYISVRWNWIENCWGLQSFFLTMKLRCSSVQKVQWLSENVFLRFNQSQFQYRYVTVYSFKQINLDYIALMMRSNCVTNVFISQLLITPHITFSKSLWLTDLYSLQTQNSD